MEQPNTPTVSNDQAKIQPPRAKQPWHRPTLIYVSLKATHNAQGSISDGSAGRGSSI